MKDFNEVGLSELDATVLKTINGGDNADLVVNNLALAGTMLGVGAMVVAGPIGWVGLATTIIGGGTAVYGLGKGIAW